MLSVLEVSWTVHDMNLFFCPPADPGTMSTLSLAQRLPFPAFPLRASLALAPGPVQAAAPPAEYHSDSAESLEEIPVVLAKLGSLSTTDDASSSLHRAVPAVPLISPHLRNKRKALASHSNKSIVHLRFEMASTHQPTVFVSQVSGDPPETYKEEFSVGRTQSGSRPASRASLASGLETWMEL